MELVVLISGHFLWWGYEFPWPLHCWVILNLHKDLFEWGIEKGVTLEEAGQKSRPSAFLIRIKGGSRPRVAINLAKPFVLLLLFPIGLWVQCLSFVGQSWCPLHSCASGHKAITFPYCPMGTLKVRK